MGVAVVVILHVVIWLITLRGLIRSRGRRAKACDAIVGIVEEGQEVMKEHRDLPALDAGLLAGAQAVEHYAPSSPLSCSD